MDTAAMDSCLTIDRISNLPCSVTNEILKYLPLDEAVRTSILARDWRYKWRTIPHLVFDWNFRMKLVEKHTLDSVIYQVLLLHRGSIIKFTLESRNDDNSFCSAVDQWLNFLSDNRTEELTLHFSPSRNSRFMTDLSHSLFSFDHLKHLSLLNCSLKPPSSFKGFGKLVTLHLKNVLLIESGEHIKFISKCPMLERLTIEHLFIYLSDYDDMNLAEFELEIDAPNLKSFAFRGKCPSLCFKNTSLLEEVSINFYQIPSPGKYGINLIKYFGQLSSIKNFKLNWNFLQFLSAGVVPQRLPNNLSHLSDLRCPVNFAAIAEVSCALCLMRSSPNLQNVEISSKTALDKDMVPSTEFLKEQQQLKLTLRHLKNVEIDSFSGSKPEMEFVKLVLSGATALIKLELKLRKHLNDATKEGYLMFKELAGFSRASSEAKIIT